MNDNVIKVNFRRNKHDPYSDREEYFRRWREHLKKRSEKTKGGRKILRSLERIALMITGYRIKAGISAKSCSGMDCMDVVDVFERQGFYKIMLNRIESFSMARSIGWDVVVNVKIDGNGAFEEKTKFPRNAYIEINYYTLEKEPNSLH